MASAAVDDLKRLRALDREAAWGVTDFQWALSRPSPVLLPVHHTRVEQVVVAAPVPTPAPEAPMDAPSAPAASTASLVSPSMAVEQDLSLPLTESATAEIRRLESSVHHLTEINDRVMAQNIALLADLEAAQKAVRDLRAEKDALAQQLLARLGPAQ